MKSKVDYFKEQLFSEYEPNSVFAEISTGNWIYAINSLIRRKYGSFVEDWKTNLEGDFSKIQKVNELDNLPIVLRSYSQGITLTLSLKSRSEKDFVPWDTVGLISDFYYSITNLLDILIIGQTGRRPHNHTNRINQFDSLKRLMPHPFDMYTAYNANLWNGRSKITQKQYTSHLPSIGVSRDSASESSINQWHTDINFDVACDILLGYLRGTTGFYMDEIYEKFLKDSGFKDFRKQEARDGVNPRLKDSNVNFLDCLYRYRTKAHYRDFVYLTNNKFESSIGKRNEYIDTKFTRALYEISYFNTVVVLRYLEKKLGATEAKAILAAILTSLKPTQEKLWDSLL